MNKMKVVMTAKGTVRNPNGESKEIELKAERFVTPTEAEKYGNRIGERRGNSGSQRGV